MLNVLAGLRRSDGLSLAPRVLKFAPPSARNPEPPRARRALLFPLVAPSIMADLTSSKAHRLEWHNRQLPSRRPTNWRHKLSLNDRYSVKSESIPQLTASNPGGKLEQPCRASG